MATDFIFEPKKETTECLGGMVAEVYRTEKGVEQTRCVPNITNSIKRRKKSECLGGMVEEVYRDEKGIEHTRCVSMYVGLSFPKKDSKCWGSLIEQVYRDEKGIERTRCVSNYKDLRVDRNTSSQVSDGLVRLFKLTESPKEQNKLKLVIKELQNKYPPSSTEIIDEPSTGSR